MSIYKRFGFRVIEEFTVPGMTHKLVAMLKEPQVKGISKNTGSVLK